MSGWDKGRPPPPFSKWRRASPAEKDRQAATADALRRELLIIGAGGRVKGLARRARPATGRVRVCSDEAAELRAFLGEHGRDIAGLLAVVAGDAERELTLARAYRAVRTGQPGAHEVWGRLVRQLSV